MAEVWMVVEKTKVKQEGSFHVWDQFKKLLVVARSELQSSREIYEMLIR